MANTVRDIKKDAIAAAELTREVVEVLGDVLPAETRGSFTERVYQIFLFELLGPPMEMFGLLGGGTNAPGDTLDFLPEITKAEVKN